MTLGYFRQKIILLLFLLLPLQTTYGDENELTIFVDRSYPPYMYEVDKNHAEGLYPRLLKKIISGTGYNAKILAVPWKRALLYGETGTGLVGGAYKNNKRLKHYDYSLPLYEEKMVIFINKDKPFVYNDIGDLFEKTIGVNRGWSYGQKFDEAREAKLFEVIVRDDPGESFKMLTLGRIDCLILDQLSGDFYAQHLEVNDKVASLPTPFSLNNGHLIIPKELNMKAFLDKFDSNLKEMREEGIYQEVVQGFVLGTLPGEYR